MDLKYIQKLMKMLDSSNLAEIEIEEEGKRIKLSKPKSRTISGAEYFAPHNFIQQQPQFAEVHQTAIPAEIKAEVKEEIPQESYYEVRSPMVGTFYSSPSPDADQYVKPGTVVKEGSVLCIIEAMKLMNEIESEVSGKIVKIMAENGKAVEYNQVLFLIDKS